MSKKNSIDDDGRTIVDMNVDGMKNYVSEEQKEKVNDIRKLDLSKKERRAIFKAAVLSTIPAVLFILTAFGIAYFLVYLWLAP